ncbi:MAG: TAXI family TRAP transporter solute-binding subunit [Pseudodonghicola sp.]
MTRLRSLAATAAGSVIVALGLSTAAAAQDYQWPRLLVIGTPGTSTGSFASTNGWGPILQKETGTTVRIVPEDNELQRYRRLTERKDIAIASTAAAMMRFQIEGIGGYAATRPAPLRILWHHNDTPWGYVVAGDSPIHSMEDLRKGGVRVADGVFATTMSTAVEKALPAYLGIDPDKAGETFTYVPAASYGANCRAVVEGKADIAHCAPISSIMSELEGAPGGIRWIPMPASETEAWARYLEHRPMLVPTRIDLGVKSAQGVEGITSNYLYSVPASADADFVYNMAKWMHQSFDHYKGTHALAARMSAEQFRAYLDRSPLPVHEGTVRYLREIGMWTDADDAWNAAAIAKVDAWVAARQAALDEARDRGVKPDAESQEFLDIFNAHTAGLDGFRSRL